MHEADSDSDGGTGAPAGLVKTGDVSGVIYRPLACPDGPWRFEGTWTSKTEEHPQPCNFVVTQGGSDGDAAARAAAGGAAVADVGISATFASSSVRACVRVQVTHLCFSAHGRSGAVNRTFVTPLALP